MFHVAFALILQFGPPWLPPAETMPPPRPAIAFPLGTIIARYAVALELLDRREVRYTFAHPDSFPDDWAMLCRRMQELRDAPPLTDATRFPPREVCNELLAFNRSYRCHLEHAIAFRPTRERRALLIETDRLHTLWDLARDSRCEYYYVTVRRTAMKRLKEMLGDDAYYRGEMPPHVPF